MYAQGLSHQIWSVAVLLAGAQNAGLGYLKLELLVYLLTQST